MRAFTASTAISATQIASGKILTANADASKEKPAYFTARIGAGTTAITAFRGTDRIIEYTVNGGSVVKVNDKDENSDETITITVNDAAVFLKVCPASNGPEPSHQCNEC
ncbi:MAG: hypothetical protein LBU24_04330 [Methanocalculaceae archaeon]|nr:hypothetical protein [Methanocalculaceae archaeon]